MQAKGAPCLWKAAETQREGHNLGQSTLWKRSGTGRLHQRVTSTNPACTTDPCTKDFQKALFTLLLTHLGRASPPVQPFQRSSCMCWRSLPRILCPCAQGHPLPPAPPRGDPLWDPGLPLSITSSVLLQHHPAPSLFPLHKTLHSCSPSHPGSCQGIWGGPAQSPKCTPSAA